MLFHLFNCSDKTRQEEILNAQKFTAHNECNAQRCDDMWCDVRACLIYPIHRRLLERLIFVFAQMKVMQMRRLIDRMTILGAHVNC